MGPARNSPTAGAGPNAYSQQEPGTQVNPQPPQTTNIPRQGTTQRPQPSMAPEAATRASTGAKIKKNTRASLKIATLNMRGRGQDKWNHINQLMRSKRIGIIVLQETHLNEQHAARMHHLFGKRIKIYYTADQDNPNSKGVAVVLNKEITNVHDISSTEIVPGRALNIVIPWHQDQTINILAIYAPNSTKENENFWRHLRQKWQQGNRPKPDLMLGDFNIVEDAIDRITSHPDDGNAVEALQELKSYLKLEDGWRTFNPYKKEFTFLQKATGTQSRIDRIYASGETIKYSYDWLTEPPGIQTEHQMVTTKITSPTMPYIGKGRWTMPLHLLKDKKLMEKIQKMTLELEQALEACSTSRTEANNPQKCSKNTRQK